MSQTKNRRATKLQQGIGGVERGKLQEHLQLKRKNTKKKPERDEG